jgi:triphosphoribosyl-dephospho-CoA synthase
LPFATPGPPDLGTWAEVACLLECTARKPGNVHQGASFADTKFDEFVHSAAAIAPVFRQADKLTVGEIVLRAVQATRQVVGKNTNLGIILALAPLAAAPSPDQADVQGVLSRLSVADADLAYQAIRLASPGGLGRAPEQDVEQRPSVTLLKAMELAKDRDLIAKQFVTAYRDVYSQLLPELLQSIHRGYPLEQAIVAVFIRGLITLGDTLILRKCGPAIEQEARERAAAVMRRGWPLESSGIQAIRELNVWLRADGHRRNPGTMADLLAATLFLALRGGTITLPLEIPWECSVL